MGSSDGTDPGAVVEEANDGGGEAVPIEWGALSRRLREIPETEWDAVLLDDIRSHVAVVLNLPSADAVHPQRAFTEMGLDSLGAVELRGRLILSTVSQN